MISSHAQYQAMRSRQHSSEMGLGFHAADSIGFELRMNQRRSNMCGGGGVTIGRGALLLCRDVFMGSGVCHGSGDIVGRDLIIFTTSTSESNATTDRSAIMTRLVSTMGVVNLHLYMKYCKYPMMHQSLKNSN